MEDGDDDFGDLYADVEVEARSAINTVPQLSELKFVSDETGKPNSVLEASSDKEDRASDGVDIDDDDDDEDDLDIVLNSDDDNIGHGEALTIVRNNTILRSGELEDEEDDDLGREEFVGGKAACKTVSDGDGINQSLIGGGKAAYNPHSQYKYIRSQSAAYASDLKGNGCGAVSYSSREDNGYCQRMGLKSMGPQSGQRFSLPRSRTILDVNIDIFEQKPWAHPGADITDYFNFGLNEDSWKIYCNQVDEYRHGEPMSNGIPALEPAQLMERKGQSIRVEDSIVERVPSMDVMRQLDRDSDVIQINVQDPEGHCSGSVKEGLGHLNSSAPEASKHGDFSGDVVTDHLSFSSASEDESVEGNLQEMETQATKRSSNRRGSSKPATRGSENHEVDHQCSRRAICGSEGTSDNTKERGGEDTCTTDPSILVAESSENGDAYIDRRRFYIHENKSFKASKRLDDKRKPGNHIYRAIHSIPVYGDSKPKYHNENDESYSRRLDAKRNFGGHRYHTRYNSPVYENRTHKDLRHESRHEIDESCSRRPDDKRKHGEYRYRARHSSPVYNNKSHHENNDYLMHSTVGHNRMNGRLHAFDPYDEENISYSKESELPSDYYCERFSDYEDWDTSARDLHRKGYERFGATMDPSVFRSEEEEYFGERRRYIKDEEAIARGWCHNKRELAVENVDVFRYEGENEFFLEREYADYIQGGKFRKSLTCNGRKRAHFERGYVKHVAYTRWEFRGPRINKRRFGSLADELNNFLPKADHSFASPSYGEPYINNNRRRCNMMSRNNLFGRHWTERFPDDGYSEPFDREDYTIDIDDGVDMGRTRPHWQSEMQWDEDEVMSRHEDAKFCAKGASFPFEKVSRCKRFVSEYGSDHVEGHKDKQNREVKSGNKIDGLIIDDPHAEGCRNYNKQTREVISGNKCGKSLTPNVIHGVSHEQPSPSCGNSHLVVGEGKSCDEEDDKAEWKKGNLDLDLCISNNEDGNGKMDDSRIVEAMAKMEKRRARFNGSITTSTTTTTTTTRNDSDGATKLTTVADSTKQQRPARKRRWGFLEKKT